MGRQNVTRIGRKKLVKKEMKNHYNKKMKS